MEWRQVVEKFCQGDRDAFCTVYQRYFDDIYNYICYSVGHDYAEDVTQEIFIRVMKNCSQFRGDSELRTWIFSIARRQIADWFRRRRIRPANWLSETVPDLVPGPDETYYIQEQAREVLNILANLGFRARSVVVLRTMYGFSGKEVARIMDMSEGNVRTVMHRTLKKVQAQLGISQREVSGGV